MVELLFAFAVFMAVIIGVEKILERRERRNK